MCMSRQNLVALGSDVYLIGNNYGQTVCFDAIRGSHVS